MFFARAEEDVGNWLSVCFVVYVKLFHRRTTYLMLHIFAERVKTVFVFRLRIDRISLVEAEREEEA